MARTGTHRSLVPNSCWRSARTAAKGELCVIVAQSGCTSAPMSTVVLHPGLRLLPRLLPPCYLLKAPVTHFAVSAASCGSDEVVWRPASCDLGKTRALEVLVHSCLRAGGERKILQILIQTCSSQNSRRRALSLFAPRAVAENCSVCVMEACSLAWSVAAKCGVALFEFGLRRPLRSI